MALEKLLIFGLALSIVIAMATWLGKTGDVRETEKTGYMNEVTKLKEMAD